MTYKHSNHSNFPRFIKHGPSVFIDHGVLTTLISVSSNVRFKGEDNPIEEYISMSRLPRYMLDVIISITFQFKSSKQDPTPEVRAKYAKPAVWYVHHYPPRVSSSPVGSSAVAGFASTSWIRFDFAVMNPAGIAFAWLSFITASYLAAVLLSPHQNPAPSIANARTPSGTPTPTPIATLLDDDIPSPLAVPVTVAVTVAAVVPVVLPPILTNVFSSVNVLSSVQHSLEDPQHHFSP